eukprot:30687-Eustigmatos_ZCMA.PRE.1
MCGGIGWAPAGRRAWLADVCGCHHNSISEFWRRNCIVTQELAMGKDRAPLVALPALLCPAWKLR